MPGVVVLKPMIPVVEGAKIFRAWEPRITVMDLMKMVAEKLAVADEKLLLK
jgi:hypothetical protein